jgi:prophage regulatory protein
MLAESPVVSSTFPVSRILRLRDVCERTGLSPATVARKSRCGADSFPAARRLGAKSVGWLSAEIDDWINSRPVSAQVE